MGCRTTWAGRHTLKIGEDRRLRVDFKEFEELETEDLTGTPTVVLVDAGSGVVISAAAIDGTGVAAWFDATAAVVADSDQFVNGGMGYSEYEVEWTIGTTGGATLVRSSTLKIEE
jgi:hypothetical protein